MFTETGGSVHSHEIDIPFTYTEDVPGHAHAVHIPPGYSTEYEADNTPYIQLLVCEKD